MLIAAASVADSLILAWMAFGEGRSEELALVDLKRLGETRGPDRDFAAAPMLSWYSLSLLIGHPRSS